MDRMTYKFKAEQHRPLKDWDRIRCLGGVSIHCWPVTSAVCFLSNRENGKVLSQLVINYGLTIIMKNVSQHATQLKIVIADKVVLSNIEPTKRWLDDFKRDCWWSCYINLFVSSLPRHRNCSYEDHALVYRINWET